jgi:hypothetical protein
MFSARLPIADIPGRYRWELPVKNDPHYFARRAFGLPHGSNLKPNRRPKPLTLVRNSFCDPARPPLKCLIQPYAHNQFAHSDHAGLVVIRTMWLAALCLSGLGAMVAISAETPTPPPNVEASPDQTTIATGSSQDTLTKADKLEVAYVRDPVAVEPIMPVATAPETPPQPPSPPATPKIVSRHSHDPNAKKVAVVSPGRRIKGQESKKSKNVERAKLPVELRPCPRPEGFAGLLRVLNLSPGCDS